MRIHVYSPTGDVNLKDIYPMPIWYTNVPNTQYPAVCSADDIPDIPNPLYIFHTPRDVIIAKIENYHTACDPNKCPFHLMISSLDKLRL
jgi:hypothetical protein